jgi:hypothetical protein
MFVVASWRIPDFKKRCLSRCWLSGSWFTLGVAGKSLGTMPANGDVGRHTHEEHLYEYPTNRDLAVEGPRL